MAVLKSYRDYININLNINIVQSVLLPSVVAPNWLQTTLASLLPQYREHTVPQALFTQTSTLPPNSSSPPIRRTSPSVQLLDVTSTATIEMK